MPINRDDFYIKEKVPVFATWEGEKSGKYIVIDDNKLEEIANVNRERANRGENPTIVIGHRIKGNEAATPVIGFLDNFTVDFVNGVKTLFADMLFYPEQKDKIKQFPKRSVEVRGDNNLIPNMALLGASPPQLELGICYEDENNNVFSFSDEKYQMLSNNIFNKGDVAMADYGDEFADKVLEVLKKTDMYEFVCDLMEHSERLATEDEKMESEEDVEKKAEKADKKSEHDEELLPEKEPAEHAGPSEEDEDHDSYAMAEELKKLKTEVLKSNREKALMKLESQGFCFNLAEELEDTMEMTDVQFDKHLKRIQKFNPAAPVNMKFSIKEEKSFNGIPTADQNAKAKDLAIKKRIPFSQALKEII